MLAIEFLFSLAALAVEKIVKQTSQHFLPGRHARDWKKNGKGSDSRHRQKFIDFVDILNGLTDNMVEEEIE